MTKKFRTLMYLFTIVAVLFMSAMPSYAVYADGGTEGDTTTTDPPPTEPADPPPEESEAVDPPEEEEAEPPPEEPESPAEILEIVPDGTEIVVVNEDGDPEPLASEAAAEILVEGDPIWCPDGQAPTPGANGCTGSHAGFDDLIADLTGGGYSGDGVIWVESNYDADEDNADIIFDGTSLATLNDLSFNGGWNGVSGSTALDSSNPSVLDDRLRVVNWTGNVSVSNIDVTAPARNSLLITTDGDITVNNVSVSGSTSGSGAYLDNCDALSGPCPLTGGDVTVTNSDFSNNTATGLTVHSPGDVTINNVTADNNSVNGIVATTHDAVDADVTIKDTTTSNNTNVGIYTDEVGGNVKIKDVTADNNGAEGIRVEDTLGDVSGYNITANQNNSDGVEIDTTRGNVNLTNITANETVSGDGVDIHNTDGNVYLSKVTANTNDQNGIEVFNVDGSLGLKCVETTDNSGDGIFIQVDHNFYLKCSESKDNGGDGVQIVDAPTAQLLSFTATGNGGQDINANPAVTTVTEKNIDCSGKKKPSKGHKGPWTKLYCLPGEIKVALYNTYGDKVEFDNLCGYEAGVFDPTSWVLPEEIPGGGDDYILSLQDKMLEEIPNLEPVMDYGMPGIIAQVLDELPFMLPDGFSYASGFFTAVVEEDVLLDPLPEESDLTIRFRVPEWLDPGEALTILWWDGADWVDLGGEYSEDGYYFQITTEETGVFVLATFDS